MSKAKSLWWKKLGTYYLTSYACNHMVDQSMENGISFAMQNVDQLAALNAGWDKKTREAAMTGDGMTMDPRPCYLDYEKDDLLAVIIGSAQTGLVVVTLIIYLIYLKKRGPVKVPAWMIEPAMRTANIEPINEQEYEQTLNQVRQERGVQE
jgi:hypothetical protein